MEKEKITLVKYQPGSKVVRVTSDTYDTITSLSEQSGVSIPQILKKIVDFAIDKIEIMEE